MSVLYKFKNTIDYDSIKFDGIYISTADLKSQIVQQKKLGHSELQVENERTHEIYTDDQPIPKNTSVIVSRLPFASARKRPRPTPSSQPGPATSSTVASSFNDHRDAAIELVCNTKRDMTEEEKIKQIQSQSAKDFDPSRYARGRGGRGPRGGGHFVPRSNYTCRKCGIPGHSIYDCKAGAMPKIKRSTGIPRDFLVKVDSKEKGALMTPDGEYVVPLIDKEAYSKPKIERAPFFEDGTPSEE